MSADAGPPAQYWIRNEQGRVWGPYSAAALERMAGQLTGSCEVALDGKTFRPSGEFPELKNLLDRPAARAPEAERAPPPPPPMRIGRATAAAFNIKDGMVVKGGAAPDAAPAAAPAQSKPAAPAPKPGPSASSSAPPKPAAPAPSSAGQAQPKPAPPAPKPAAGGPAAAQAAAPAEEVPAQGDLDAFSPVRLYALAALTSATGLLRLNLESGRSLQIAFRRGVPEHLSSDDPELSLVRFLQRRGTLSGPQGLAAEEHARKTSGDLVSALFALQLIPPSSAHEVMGEHAQFLLDRALLCWRGTFTFAKDAPPPAGSFPLGQRWTLLAEAVRRLEPAPLRARLGKRLQQPVVRSGGLGLGRIEELALNAHEARFFASIDGVRKGEELLQGADPALALRLLHLLSELGHLSFVGDAPRAAPPPPAPAPAPQPNAPPRTAAELPRIATRPPPSPQRPQDARRPPPPVVGAPGTKPAAPAAPPSAPPPVPTFASGPAGETPEAQLRRLTALRDKLSTANHFEALGLSRKATAADVKRTFFGVARELHPDTVTDPAQQPLRAIKEELFARMNEAAQVLSDEKRRKEYEEELDGSQVDVARIFAAEEAFRKAEIMVKARKYAEGLELIEEALKLNADEAEFYAWRGYAKFMLAKDRKVVYADCVADCRRALKMVERCLPAHLFLGHMAKVMGETKSASTSYQKVLDLDQTNIEAQRELRLLGKK